MLTEKEITKEMYRLANVKKLDESGAIIKLIALSALQWVMEIEINSPSEKMLLVDKDLEQVRKRKVNPHG